jgi:hypothetical protein
LPDKAKATMAKKTGFNFGFTEKTYQDLYISQNIGVVGG